MDLDLDKFPNLPTLPPFFFLCCQTKAKQDYLPKEKLERYLNSNPSSSLSSLVPRGITEDELTMELTDKFTSVSSWFTSGVKNFCQLGFYLTKIFEAYLGQLSYKCMVHHSNWNLRSNRASELLFNRIRFFRNFLQGFPNPKEVGHGASWLVCWTPHRVVRVQSLTRDIVLCFWI